MQVARVSLAVSSGLAAGWLAGWWLADLVAGWLTAWLAGWLDGGRLPKLASQISKQKSQTNFEYMYHLLVGSSRYDLKSTRDMSLELQHKYAIHICAWVVHGT
jgi:hypothetical protein